MRKLTAAVIAAGAALFALTTWAATGSGNNFTVTPLMGMRLPIPGVTGGLGVEPIGRSWMELQGQAFSILDQHNHAPGYGLPIPANGLSIDGDVPWNGFNLTSLRSARFSPITLGSVTALDVGTVFVSGADLYYVDTSGNVVRLTASGAIAGTPGSISGLVSPAAVTYTPVSKLFSFTSSSGYAANMSHGPTSICDATVSGGNCATVKVPGSLAANYSVTLPASLPGATKILTVDSTGQVGDSYDVDGSTLTVAGGLLEISPSGVTSVQLASNSVTQAKIADGAVTTSKIADGAVTVAKTGATSAATANAHVVRDVSGRAQFADPSAAQDAVTRAYLETNPAWNASPQSIGTGWTNAATNFAFYNDALRGVVRLRGALRHSGVTGSDTTLATLPTGGYRPFRTAIITVPFNLGGTYQVGVVQIDTGGVITVLSPTTSFNTNDYVYFDGISFDTH